MGCIHGLICHKLIKGHCCWLPGDVDADGDGLEDALEALEEAAEQLQVPFLSAAVLASSTLLRSSHHSGSPCPCLALHLALLRSCASDSRGGQACGTLTKLLC